jgi:hypothetical protein
MSLSKRSWIFVIFALLFVVSAPNGLTADQPLRLLFLGSSSTYFHDLPFQVADLLTANGIPAEADLVGKSGTGVQMYLRPDFKAEYGLQNGETVLTKIRDGKYDLVVLQIPTDYLAGQAGNDSEEFDRSIDIYANAARKAGAEVILYEQGWQEGELFDKGDAMIRAAALRNNINMIPCRSAWRIVRKEHPMLEMHDLPDTTHPGGLGTYLNLCCFYAGITRQSPEGLTLREVKRWPFYMNEDGKRKRNRKECDYYQVNEILAPYLQKVAWQSWNKIEEELKTK